MKRFLSLLTVIAFIGISQIYGADTWEKVTDYSALSTSDTYVIAGNIKGGSTWYSLKNNQVTSNTNLPVGSTLTISNNKITSTISADETWVLESTSTSGVFYIKSTKGAYYLQNDGNTGSKIKSKSSTDGENKWRIHYTQTSNNKTVTGLYNVGKSRELGCYNSSNWRCYTSTNYGNLDGAEVCLYRKVTASCTYKLSLSKVVSGNGSFNVYQGSVSDGNLIAFTNNAASIDNCGSGNTTLVVVPTANTHYHVDAVEATNKKNGTSISASNGQYSIQYAQGSNVTSQITVTFAEDPHSSIVLNDANGDGSAITNKYVGENYTLPTTAATCTGKTFVGWSTEPVSKTNTKPTSNFYEPGATYENLPASIKFYAVYAKVSGTIDTYKKISQTSELTNGLSVIIMNGTKALENDDWLYDATPTIENGLITSDASGIIWTYNTISGGFTLKNTSGKYLKAQNVKNEYITLADASYTWTFSEEADFVLKGSDNRYLEYYNSAFTSYGSYSSNNASCYQMDIYIPNWSLSSYATGCEACAVDPTIGAAGLKSEGAYGLDGVEVSVSGMSTGSDACEWTDYGFYWGTSANKKANKKQVGTNGSATSFEATLAFEAPTQLTTSTTYYFCAYGKNSKSGAAIAYGTEASFTPQSVTFNMNGHGSQVATQYVNNGGTATDPGTTSITGYTFNGWKLNSSAYSFSSAVTGDITLVADWSPQSYTITYKDQGGSNFSGTQTDAPETHTYGTPTTLKIPTKTGYDFGGWFTASNCASGAVGNTIAASLSATGYTDDIILYAKWTAKTTNLVLNKNNSDESGTANGSGSVSYDGGSATITTAATRTGYHLDGGYYTNGESPLKVLNENGSFAVDANGDVDGYVDDNKWNNTNSEVTLYAHWAANKYYVAFNKNSNDATGEMSNQEFTYDAEAKALTENAFEIAASTHKYFNGWNTEANGSGTPYKDKASIQNLAASGTITLYAQWADHTYTNYRTLCCTKYDITAETPENGSFTVKDGDDDVDKACEGTTISIAATPAPDNYVFNHWSIVDGELNDITESLLGENPPASTSFEMPAYAITINAVFNLKTTEYAVTLHDNNGGEHNGSATVSTNGTVLSNISLPTKEGYHVAGYYLEAGCETLVANAAGTLQANVDGVTDENAQFIKGEAITLYAAWEGNKYTVTISKNYTETTKDYTATFGAAMPDMSDFNQFTRAGYTLTGIFANNNGTGTKYYDENKASAHVWDQPNNATIYAAWSPKNYTITLYDGETKEGTISVTYDSDANLTDAVDIPVKTGYIFGGYWTGENGTDKKLIGTDGYVIASVSGYTNADTEWRKANNVDLYAYWIPSYTVTWSVNGTTTTEQVVSGEKVASMHAAPTSSDCDDAKVFVGWRAEKITGTADTNPGSIFTDVDGSPEITEDVTFFAVFADSNEETKHLTNSEIQTFHSADATNHGNYKKGPFTLTSADGNWYGVLATANTGGSYSVNVKAEAVDLETDATSDKVRPYLMSPTYSKNVKAVTITAKHGAQSGTRTIYICSAATDSPENNNIGTASITNTNTAHEVTLSGSATTLYLYASNAVMISSIDVTIGTPSNYVTQCASCDDPATFTNTTPAMSNIACTGATVTATGGLETLGSEGCNISDYGFVIGASENPAIDGEGVTKLQVGTSNPTTGADFSYDITGLTKGTQYNVRAYAINKYGIAYSGNKSFWTKDVSSIAITTAPTKTNYIVGETFDATGMVVTATMAGGASENVTEEVTFSNDALTVGANQDFAINYTLCETGKSVNQVINVYTLTVTEDTNDDKGVASYTSGATFSVSGLATYYTASFNVTNGEIQDNSNGTYTVINPTGNVTVTVNYVEALPVNVYYKVNGTTISSLSPEGLYQGETATLPTASQLSTAMSALSMTMSDYGNFVGWSETEFGYQTTEPTLASGTQTINADKTYYAVFTNLNKVRIDESVITSGSYPSQESTKQVGDINFKYHNILSQSGYLQLKWNGTPYGYIYNSDEIVNVLRIESADYNVSVYACTTAGTTTGSAISAETREDTDPYVYILPANTSYFKLSAEKDVQCKPDYIDIYYAPEAVYYATQFSTLTFKKADGTTDKTIQKATNDTYALTNADVPSENDTPEGYTFLNKWFDGTDTYAKDAVVTLSSDIVLKPCWDIEVNDNATVPAANVEASDITVNEGKTLTLTLTEDTKLGDIIVENGGTLTISGDKKVDAKDFYIEAQEGYSGQVKGNGTIAVFGQAYYDLTLNPSGTMNHDLWYAFAVPFPVDAATGIQRLSNDGKTANAGFNSHYVLLKYDSEERAANGKGNSWKYITKGETLMPGNFYMIALNSNVYNRVRMTKKAGATLNNKADLNLAEYTNNGTSAAKDKNWNALANNALAYANVDAEGGNDALKVITYNSENNSYDEFDYGDITLTVGTPFFVQAVEQGTMSVTIAATNNTTVKAPAHEVMATEEFQLRLGADTESYYDKLFVSANEDAKSEYQIGHDLAKMGVSSTIPQMYVPAYDTKLCDAEFPLVNNQASFPLTFVAPQAGTYQLYVAREARDAELYLTYEGAIIWNLSMGAYELELTKGTTEGYGLLLQAKAPGAATGVDNIDASEAAQKVIINDHVYILRNGQMYGVDGKAVK